MNDFAKFTDSCLNRAYRAIKRLHDAAWYAKDLAAVERHQAQLDAIQCEFQSRA